MGEWTLFSNHGHVLVCLARNKRARLRDVASDVGITERAVQKIVSELQQAGLISISKHGRCNQYEIHGKKNLRHRLESHCSVGRLLQLVVKPEAEDSAESAIGQRPEKSERKQKVSAPRTRPEAAQPSRPAAEVTKPAKRQPEKSAEKPKRSPDEDTRKQGSLF